jgi:adenine-specific DNA-methyltransferase
MESEHKYIKNDKLTKKIIKIKTLEKVKRLNYIGSKFQLLDWLITTIKEKTGLGKKEEKSFKGIKIADLFAGTGIVSFEFRKEGATILSNDAELYSSIITYALTKSTYNDKTKEIINSLNIKLENKEYLETIGFITKNYSPYNGNERMFFTIDNAQRIDFLRHQIELYHDLNTNDYNFILASLIISADYVSNVPAVYGCYLKKFKTKALNSLSLNPIHYLECDLESDSVSSSETFQQNVLDTEFIESIQSFKPDIVYLDPPYNERQYSKNYFPLNIIAKKPSELETTDINYLKGKTGIPSDCFISPFCKKGGIVEKSFDSLIKALYDAKIKWIFLSYNSESIVSKEKLTEILSKYGTVEIIERDYKRFKSFEYNEDKSIKEYLFCLNL